MNTYLVTIKIESGDEFVIREKSLSLGEALKRALNKIDIPKDIVKFNIDVERI